MTIACWERQRTKPLTHRQVGMYDILLAQQKDVPHVDVVGGDIHTEKLLLPCTFVLHMRRVTYHHSSSMHRVTKLTPLHMLEADKQDT